MESSSLDGKYLDFSASVHLHSGHFVLHFDITMISWDFLSANQSLYVPQ